jgi:hypothetical protein
MRRGLALLAALSLVLVLPASVSAARATRVTDHSVNLSCDGIHPTSGSGFAYFGAGSSDLNGSDAFFDAWNGDDPIGQPDIHRDYDQPADVTWDGTTLAGSFPLMDSSGSPAGTASFSAILTAVGDPYEINDSFKDGNHKFQATGTGQPMQPTGSLVIPSTGQTFDLANCFGDMSTVSTFATNPTSFVTHFSERTTNCDLVDASGNTGFLFVDLATDDVFVDSAVFPASGAPAIGASGGGPLVGGTLDTSLDTYLWDTGAPAGVAGSIHVTFSETGEKFDRLFRAGDFRRVSRGTLIDLEGTLTIGAYVFDLGACVGGDYRTKIIGTAPRGPKPGGKVPANDLPSGAKLLAVGGSATVQTKGASPDREAPYPCLTFEEPDGSMFEVPVANTVWYKVTGTGGRVTVDTTGSDFDTVLAIYTASAGGGFAPVAGGCVDDVPTPPVLRSLQAAATIPTGLGTTYYVQIGGFPDSAFPYGNLKVSVR